MGIGARQESDFFTEGLRRKKQTGADRGQEQTDNKGRMLYPAQCKQDAKEVADQVEMGTTGQLFECSDQLSSTAVVDFVMCLCLVALEEIHHTEPRIFCSEKVLPANTRDSTYLEQGLL
jgi:hypothetical protein